MLEFTADVGSQSKERYMSRRFALVLAAGLVLGLGYVPAIAAEEAKPAAPAPAQEAKGIDGPWYYEMEGRDGQKMAVQMRFKQDGEKLTGTVGGMRGEPAEISEGTIKNGEVKFKVVRKWNENEFVTNYTGKVEGDTLKLKSSMERNGQVRERDIEAKRGEAPKAEAPAQQ